MVLVEGALTFGWEFRDRATKEVFASDLIGGTTTEATITIEVELARGAKTRLTHTVSVMSDEGGLSTVLRYSALDTEVSVIFLQKGREMLNRGR